MTHGHIQKRKTRVMRGTVGMFERPNVQLPGSRQIASSGEGSFSSQPTEASERVSPKKGNPLNMTCCFGMFC